jgi:hypothetical protein
MIYETLHRILTIELNEWTPERVGSSRSTSGTRRINFILHGKLEYLSISKNCMYQYSV